MRALLRWYGASPLHLLAFLGCFGLAGYAAAQLVPSRPLGIATWFLGAVVGHDLLLFPLYSLADRSAAAVIRHRTAELPALPWVNYLRVPAALSGLLLLVWFPLIVRLRTRYQASTTLSPSPFLWHWLAVTGALFLLSAAALALRIRTLPRPAAPPAPPSPLPPQPAPGTGHPGRAPEPARDLPPQGGSAPVTPSPRRQTVVRKAGSARPGRDQDDEHGPAV